MNQSAFVIDIPMILGDMGYTFDVSLCCVSGVGIPKLEKLPTLAGEEKHVAGGVERSELSSLSKIGSAFSFAAGEKVSNS